MRHTGNEMLDELLRSKLLINTTATINHQFSVL